MFTFSTYLDTITTEYLFKNGRIRARRCSIMVNDKSADPMYRITAEKANGTTSPG